MDMTPQPVDTHLLQGEEYVNIANCVQDSSSGSPVKSSIDFLPDLQELPNNMDMTPQPVDAHLLQGEEYVNIANCVNRSSFRGLTPYALQLRLPPRHVE